MTAYVDQVRQCLPNPKWRWRRSCHLIADSAEELHAFAAGLDLKREWFQGQSVLPHYDLTEGRRRQAIRQGAVAITDAELVERLERARRDAR